jgi:HEAT repeat protein
MTIMRLTLIVGIVLTIFPLRVIATEKEENVGEKIKEAITIFIGGSSRERVKAAGDLAMFKPEDLITYGAWEPFTKVLKEDDSPHVQQAVIEALGVQGKDASELDKRKIIDLIVKTIKNENMHSVVRAKAIVIIGPLMSRVDAQYKGMKTTSHGRVIIRPLESKDVGERGLLASYLEKQLDANGTILTKAIMETLNLWNWDLGDRIWKDVVTDDLYLRRPAIKALKNQIILNDLKIDPVKARDLLYIIDNDQRNKDLRIDLINLLTFAVKNGSKISIADILEKIIEKNTDSQVTFAAVNAIGSTSDPNLMRLLLNVFDRYKDNRKTESMMIRSAACAAAGDFIALLDKHYEYYVRYRRNFEKLIEKLVEALIKDNSSLVRKEAAYALSNMTSEKFDRRKPVAALIKVVNDPDQSVAKTVLDSLKFLTVQDFGKDTKAWQRWYQANKRDLIAK